MPHHNVGNIRGATSAQLQHATIAAICENMQHEMCSNLLYAKVLGSGGLEPPLLVALLPLVLGSSVIQFVGKVKQKVLTV